MTRRAKRYERGSSGMIFVLVVSMLLAALAAGLIRVATSATILEARGLYQLRAQENARSVVAMAQAALAEQLGPVIKAAVEGAQGTVNMRVPILVGSEWKAIHWEYDLTTPEYGPDESGEVDVIIRLAGPPDSRTLSGLSAERRGVTLDGYDFTVEIEGTGRSSMKATAHAVEHAKEKVWLLGGPDDSTLIRKVKTAAATGGSDAGESDGRFERACGPLRTW